MLQVFDLTKGYGDRVIFKDVTFALQKGERLGLVGRNGHGKSTLFKLILGDEDPDEGRIMVPQRYKVGHLSQHLEFDEATIVDDVALGLPEDEKEMVYKAEAILLGLGFEEKDFGKPASEFSGGYQIRLNLGRLLVSEPNLLLLDEPTNYLDIVSVRWLTRFLRAWRNELILITHDREFMDSVTTHTAVIHRQKLRKVKGDTEKLYAQVAQDEEVYEKTVKNEAKKRAQVERFIERFHAQPRLASQVQSKAKMLERQGEKEELEKIATLEFQFNEAVFPARTQVEVRDLSFNYPGGARLISKLSLAIDKGERIGVIGMNGRGKSTLLRLLAHELEPLEGEIKTHPETKLSYFGQTNIDRLHPSQTVEDEVQTSNNMLSRTQVRGICGAMMFPGDDALKRVAVLSGGEKSRTLLGKILARPSNLLLLDEPTSHLDIDSIQALVEACQAYEGAVVIVTHSEMILKALATKLVYFQGGEVKVFPGGYEDFLERIGWDNEQEVY